MSTFVNKSVALETGFPNALRIEGDAPNNPFQNPIVVVYPKINQALHRGSQTDTTTAYTGAKLGLGGNWAAQLEYGWGKTTTESSSPPTAITSDGRAALEGSDEFNVIRDLNTFPVEIPDEFRVRGLTFDGPFDNIFQIVSARASGPIYSLPAGPVNAAVLAEFRKNDLEEGLERSFNSRTLDFRYTFTPKRSREVSSLYGEVLIPVFGEQSALPLLQELDFQFAFRYDEYSQQGPVEFGINVDSASGPFPEVENFTTEYSETEYTAGLRWVVSEDLLLRASLATGFLPPRLELVRNSPIQDNFVFFFDPARGDELVLDIIPSRAGGNPDLVTVVGRAALWRTATFRAGISLFH